MSSNSLARRAVLKLLFKPKLLKIIFSFILQRTSRKSLHISVQITEQYYVFRFFTTRTLLAQLLITFMCQELSRLSVLSIDTENFSLVSPYLYRIKFRTDG